MTSTPPRLASAPEHVRQSLLTYQRVMNSPDKKLKEPLIKILPYVHSWVCITDDTTGEPIFGPSKFVGYRDITAQTYRDHYPYMDGRDTERVMKDWLRPVAGDDDLYAKLHEFCTNLGTRPREKCRISLLGHSFTTETSDPDQAALTELLVKVIRSLSPKRRNEIARRIA